MILGFDKYLISCFSHRLDTGVGVFDALSNMTDGRRGVLSFTCRGGVDSGNEDQFSVGSVLNAVDKLFAEYK